MVTVVDTPNRNSTSSACESGVVLFVSFIRIWLNSHTFLFAVSSRRLTPLHEYRIRRTGEISKILLKVYPDRDPGVQAVNWDSMAVEKFFDTIIENPSWIFIGLAVYTGIYLICRLFSSPKSGRNPFATDHRKPREALVTDPQARDTILKQSENA